MFFVLSFAAILASAADQDTAAANEQAEGNANQRPVFKVYRLEFHVEECSPEGQRKVVWENRNLNTLAGRPAHFLSGGEVRVKRPEDKEPVYLEYGHIVNFYPQPKDETHIQTELTIEISRVDTAKSGPDPRVVDFRVHLKRTLTLDKAIRVKRPKSDGSPGYYLCTIRVHDVSSR